MVDFIQQQNPQGVTIKGATGDISIPPLNPAVNQGNSQSQISHISNNISNDTTIPHIQEAHSPQPATQQEPRTEHKTWFNRPDVHYIKNELTSGTSTLVSNIVSRASTPTNVKAFLRSFSPKAKRKSRKVQSRDGGLEWDRTPKENHPNFPLYIFTILTLLRLYKTKDDSTGIVDPRKRMKIRYKDNKKGFVPLILLDTGPRCHVSSIKYF